MGAACAKPHSEPQGGQRPKQTGDAVEAPGRPNAVGTVRRILVAFPGAEGDYREVCWTEDPAAPFSMAQVRSCVQREAPTDLASSLDLVDEDGDALLAPSTWPEGTRVVLSLNGSLHGSLMK